MRRSPMSVKSDKPIRPGGCCWRKITSWSGPLSTRHVRMRRSSVRRTPRPSSGWRDLGVPHAGEWIRAPAPAGLLLLRWQSRIGLDPVTGRAGESGHRGGDGWAIGLTGLHEQPRLAVGEMLARQAAILLVSEESHAAPDRLGRQTTPLPWGYPGEKCAAPGVSC